MTYPHRLRSYSENLIYRIKKKPPVLSPLDVRGIENQGPKTVDQGLKVRSEVRSEVSIADIDEKMVKDGFSELKLLWQKFKRLKIGFDQINKKALDRSRSKHLQGLSNQPILMLLISGILTFFMFQ